MKTYSCGNCGYILPGPVGRCPRCGVLLRGEQVGDEAERQRRDREYRRNSPEARARREKLSMTMSGIGMFLITLLVIALFVGGCSVLGWFVLPRLLGQEAILPLAVGSAVLGGVILSLLWWGIQKTSDETLPFIVGRREKPYWEQAIDRTAKRHRDTVVLLRAGLCFALVPVLGYIGWKLGQNSEGILAVLGILAGIGAVVLWRHIDKSFLALLWVFIFVVMGVTKGLSWLLDKIHWMPDANVGAILGIVISPFLAYFLGKLLAGTPPNTWKMRREALLGTVMQNPSSIRDLDPSDQQIVLFELQKLAWAAPDAWKRLPQELQALIPPPELSPEQKNTGTSRCRAARSPKPETEQKNTPPQPTAKVFEEPEETTVVLDDLPAVVFCPTYYYNGDVDCSREVWSVHEIYDRDGKRLKPVFSRNWKEIAQGIATRNPQIRRRKGKKEELCHEAICILPEACPVRVVFKCVSESSNDRSRLDRSSHTKLVEMIFQKSHEKSGSEKISGRLFGAKRPYG